MGLHGVHDDFDLDGCLALARSLWALADQLVTTDQQRSAAGTTALKTWQGVYATQAATSIHDATVTAHNAEGGLREEARLLAGRWADEWLHEANARFQDAANAAESHKSWYDKLGDWFTGDSTYGDHPAPKRPPVPSPPGFAATEPLPHYDFG